MTEHKIFSMSFSKVYPCYITKVEKKGHSKAEVDEIINWLFGYTEQEINNIIANEIKIKNFILDAPALNPKRELIKGVICGVRVEEIEDPIMQQIRYLDKLIDELARGKKMAKILRE